MTLFRRTSLLVARRTRAPLKSPSIGTTSSGWRRDVKLSDPRHVANKTPHQPRAVPPADGEETSVAQPGEHPNKTGARRTAAVSMRRSEEHYLRRRKASPDGEWL